MARRVEKGSVWFNYTRKAEGDPGGGRSWRREENCQDNLNLMFNCRIYGSAEIETVSQIYTELENGLEKLEKLGTIERGHSKEYKEIED